MNDPVIARAHTLDQTIDAGLRAHMIRVYNYMSAALGITGAVAFFTARTPALLNMFFSQTGMTPLGWIVMLAPLGFVLFLSARINKMSFSAAKTTFWLYSGVMGLSLASIFLIYTGESIFQTFLVTAATFLSMSLYGYTTKRDLTGFGSFLRMGLFGLIIAMVVNIFMKSSMMGFVISVAGVLIFTGLTAYDTQKIKSFYRASDGQAVAGKKAIMGALSLYLDFINLFLMLLRLMGNRR